MKDISGENSIEVRIVETPAGFSVIWQSLLVLERLGLVQELENYCPWATFDLLPVFVWLIS